MINRYVSLGLATLVACTTQLCAQRYTLRQVPKYESELAVSFNVMTPASVSFQNLGSISSMFETEGAYADFAAAEDSSYVDADGNPRESDGRTYNFFVKDLFQRVDAEGNPSLNGNYIRATAIRADAVNGSFAQEDDGDPSVGWNIAYTRYLNEKRKLGFVVSMGTSGVNSDQATTWDAKITTRSDLYEGYNLDLINFTSNGYSGSYNRPRVFTPNSPNIFVSLLPLLSLGEQTLGDTVEASGQWGLDAAFYSFHLGAVYNFEVARNFDMRLSGGIAALYVSSRFEWNETVTVDSVSGGATATDSGIDKKGSFLFGGWADVGAHYKINSRSTFFTAFEYQAAGTFDQETENGHKIEFDASSMMSAKTGFSWAF